MPDKAVIAIRGLTFRYRGEARPALRALDADFAAGSRTLLVGRNGAGKSTLLDIIGGRHMVPEQAVRVLGRPAFHDTSLAADVTYLGGRFPFDVDIEVGELLAHTPGGDEARRAALVRLLDVDLRWHMHRVSDGQRRRVQLLLGLLSPPRVLLLDEITTDLDLIARMDLLRFLRHETETRGATIVYATHILDGLDAWATHIAFLDAGRLVRHEPLARALDGASLLSTVERWLRSAQGEAPR